MISVYCRMISPTLQPGPFTRDVLKVTVRDVVGATDVPKSATRLMVHLQLARPGKTYRSKTWCWRSAVRRLARHGGQCSVRAVIPAAGIST